MLLHRLSVLPYLPPCPLILLELYQLVHKAAGRVVHDPLLHQLLAEIIHGNIFHLSITGETISTAAAGRALAGVPFRTGFMFERPLTVGPRRLLRVARTGRSVNFRTQTITGGTVQCFA